LEKKRGVTDIFINKNELKAFCSNDLNLNKADLPPPNQEYKTAISLVTFNWVDLLNYPDAVE
jgi:hypothetical protein